MPRVAFTQPVDAQDHAFDRAVQLIASLESVNRLDKAAVASKQDAEKSW